MVVIVNYGVGNLNSIKNALSKIRVESVITSDPEVLKDAGKIIFPGVGSYDYAINCLGRLKLTEVLHEKALSEKTPILGICLGMQLMSKKSEEGQSPGFGWIDGETVKFSFPDDMRKLRIPHMGWNHIAVQQKGSILDNLYEEPRFYFVHSYHVRCANRENVLAVTEYGGEFTSAVIKDNIIGVQFHPEKSHKYGMQVLKNFIGI